MSRDKNMIYGVYDMTRGSGGCDDYFGYFKNKSGAKKELDIQYEYIKRKRPEDIITLTNDRVIITKGEKEDILIIIHPILLR